LNSTIILRESMVPRRSAPSTTTCHVFMPSKRVTTRYRLSMVSLSITEHPSSRRLSLPHPRGERGDVCGRHWPELLEDKDSRRPPDNDAWRETHFTGVSTPVASTQEAEVQVLLTIARIGKAGPRRARQSDDLQFTRYGEGVGGRRSTRRRGLSAVIRARPVKQAGRVPYPQWRPQLGPASALLGRAAERAAAASDVRRLGGRRWGRRPSGQSRSFPSFSAIGPFPPA
jgi:hypothetical protein